MGNKQSTFDTSYSKYKQSILCMYKYSDNNQCIFILKLLLKFVISLLIIILYSSSSSSSSHYYD